MARTTALQNLDGALTLMIAVKNSLYATKQIQTLTRPLAAALQQIVVSVNGLNGTKS